MYGYIARRHICCRCWNSNSKGGHRKYHFREILGDIRICSKCLKEWKENHGEYERLGFVYVMLDRECNVKIGWSRNPYFRMKSLYNTPTNYIYLLAFMLGDKRDEKQIIRNPGVVSNMVPGPSDEWFQPSCDVLEHVSLIVKSDISQMSKSVINKINRASSKRSLVRLIERPILDAIPSVREKLGMVVDENMSVTTWEPTVTGIQQRLLTASI